MIRVQIDRVECFSLAILERYIKSAPIEERVAIIFVDNIAMKSSKWLVTLVFSRLYLNRSISDIENVTRLILRETKVDRFVIERVKYWSYCIPRNLFSFLILIKTP